MLASSLRELEKDGLITRRQYPQMPVKVEYTINDSCGELMPILKQLAAWGIHMQESL
jgi:DNA-binding HxlR family transcriptional regulator